MTSFLIAHHLLGLTIGIATFIIIGLFHPIVIKAEYHFGTSCWWVFLALGLLGVALAVMSSDILLSSLSGVFGFSSLWTIKELFEQKRRVERGWFPENPTRKP